MAKGVTDENRRVLLGRRSKRKGTVRELQARDILNEMGFHCVKAGGSLGAWDLIAVGAVQVLAIQVKSNRWPGQQELLRMYQQDIACVKLIMRFDDRKVVRVGHVTLLDEGVKVVESTDQSFAEAQKTINARRRERKVQSRKAKAI